MSIVNLVLAGTIIAVSCLTASSQARVFGSVTKVIDGQTVEILSNRTPIVVHLQGFESPVVGQHLAETVHSHLEQLVLGKEVIARVTRINGAYSTGFVYVGGIDISAQLLRDGAGWLMVEDLGSISEAELAEYQALQSLARSEKRGVWSVPGLMSPSEIATVLKSAHDPINDPIIAQVAWNSYGSSIEDVFGHESFSIENNPCGGLVTQVIDGDTVKIRTPSGTEQTVRLAGIDAPERRQAFGIESRALLMKMALGRTVQCDSKKKDRYGRLVGRLMLDGNDVGLELIRMCAAWHYKRYSSEQTSVDRSLYASAESSARSARCGLWAGNPIQPSQFRAQQFFASFPPSNNPTAGGLIDGFSSGEGGYPNGGTPSGGTVRVRSYTRSDGTFVQGHTRSASRRR